MHSERLRLRSSRWLRDNAVVLIAAVVSSALIFGLLYDTFDGALRRWTERDLHRRAHVVGLAVESQLRGAAPAAVRDSLTTLSSTPDAENLAVCSPDGVLIAATGLGRNLGCRSPLALDSLGSGGGLVRGTLGSAAVAVTARRIDGTATLFVVQDRTFLESRRRHLLQIVFICAELALLALLLLARAGARVGSRRAEETARSVMREMRSTGAAESNVPPDLRLLVRDVRDTVERLRTEQAQPDSGVERLRRVAGSKVAGGGLVVLANREPYSHEWSDGSVVVRRPASGLVTGIEPILRACGGTWLAYGGGSADREVSDAVGRIAVPPENPEYTLRRVWVEEDRYEKYYSGFANEGLWPLCHIAHTQPAFRSGDWAAYEAVNAAFARAAVDESRDDTLLLVQDYHFALVPRLVREQAPHVVTSIFWHIPWPNSEVVGICPWKEALLEGMIAADVVGFHTRQYCLNFLETVQRYLECRVDLEQMSVTYGGHRALVRPYPISVEWPYPAATREAGAELRASLGISSDAHVALGVDRADYTKGLLERIGAVETLLEQTPSLAGKFVFVQLASPTRTRIRKYQQLSDDLQEVVARVNERFGTATWKPILLEMRTFSPEEVRGYYAMANSAVVTPLHDGMNLVAKEYVASCQDGDGALVLSRFAGAAKELDGALIVNPYDVQQVAQAILRAVRMPLVERRARMDAMRAQIAGSSIYDWSEKLLNDMATLRKENARFWPRRSARGTDDLKEVAAG